MMTKDEARRHARDHANASVQLDRLASAMAYMESCAKTPGKARVSWESGSALDGYKELAEEVSRIVTERLPLVLDEALHNIQMSAHAALHPARLDGKRTEVLP